MAEPPGPDEDGVGFPPAEVPAEGGPQPTDGGNGNGSIAGEDVQAVVQERFPGFADRVTITTDAEGLVEMTGSVPGLGDKLRVEQAVVGIEGNKMVVNRLEVEPERRGDLAIVEDLRTRFEYNPELRDAPIRIRVRDQEVFLSGSASNQELIEQALREAADVQGVRDVDVSRLRVR